MGIASKQEVRIILLKNYRYVSGGGSDTTFYVSKDEEIRIMLTADKIRIGSYDFDIKNKSKADATISMFWSLFAENLGLYTNYIGSNTKVAYGGVYSQPVTEFSGYPKLDGRIIKMKNFNNPLYEVKVRGYTPSGTKISRPVVTAQSARSFESDILADIGEMCTQLFKAAQEHVFSRQLVLAEAKFRLKTDEFGALYLTDEILTPNTAVYWRVDKPGMSFPVPFNTQPLLDAIMQFKKNGTYDRKIASAAETEASQRYQELSGRILEVS